MPWKQQSSEVHLTHGDPGSHPHSGTRSPRKLLGNEWKDSKAAGPYRWSTLLMGLGGWAALGTGAPEPGTNHGLNLPHIQQNAALWFMAVTFFSRTFVLGSPGTPPIAVVPKVTGPDFPIQDTRAWFLCRARGMSGEHFSGCVDKIHGLGRPSIRGRYCHELQCLTSLCYGRAVS